MAEDDRGVSFDTWPAVAKDHRCFVIYGFARRVGTRHRIASAAVSPDGSPVGVYDKLHLAQFGDSMEKKYFVCRGE